MNVSVRSGVACVAAAMLMKLKIAAKPLASRTTSQPWGFSVYSDQVTHPQTQMRSAQTIA